jgi:hypothetical protein
MGKKRCDDEMRERLMLLDFIQYDATHLVLGDGLLDVMGIFQLLWFTKSDTNI